MRFLHLVSGAILLFELPIPAYWLILHPFREFWRTRVRAAFAIAAGTAWLLGGAALWNIHAKLFAGTRPAWAVMVIGFALIGIEVYLLVRVERELGGRRLIGHAELTGTGEMQLQGLYAHVRHPRYTGMFCAVLGATLLSGTALLWRVIAVWWVCELLVIRLEERELLARFGPAYAEYRRRVPAFLPFRILGPART